VTKRNIEVDGPGPISRVVGRSLDWLEDTDERVELIFVLSTRIFWNLVAVVLGLIPNLLSLSRIVGTAWILVDSMQHGISLRHLVWAAVLGSTDWMDGKLARWLHIDGGFGAIFDPICDKGYVILLVLAAALDLNKPYVTGVGISMLFAETIIGVQALFQKFGRYKFTAEVAMDGKKGIAFRMLACGLAFMSAVFPGSHDFLLVMAAISATTGMGFGIVAFMNYRWQYTAHKNSVLLVSGHEVVPPPPAH
jgi:phosphatidylglycerophosphate synthase